MLLTIDAGNTNIAMGFMDGDEVKGSFRITTKTPRTSDEYGMCLRTFLHSNDVKEEDIEAVIISSVVPKINYSLSSSIIKYIGKRPIFINSDIVTGIKVQTKHPHEVGADRLVDATAAYFTKHRSCMVIDFGTATTFDYVSSEGVFRYSVIAPGVGISSAALTSQTAKLPDIEIAKPASVLGTDTVSGMQAGVVYGYMGAVQFIIRKMKEELNDPGCYVIATGGLGRIFAGELEEIDEYDPNIAYKGMNIIYRQYFASQQ